MESFYRIAKDEGKTAFVLFYAPWCEKCKRLLKIMKEVSTIFRVSYLKRVIEIGDFVALWYEVLKLKCDFIFTFDILSKLLVFWYCIGKQKRLIFFTENRNYDLFFALVIELTAHNSRID